MEQPTENGDEAAQNDDDDCFFDALDDFPFYDFAVTPQSEASTSEPTSSVTQFSSPTSSRRRRSLSRRKITAKDSNLDSSSIDPSVITKIDDFKTRNREKRYKIYRDVKENEKNLESTESTGTTHRVDSVGGVGSLAEEEDKREESTGATTGKDDQVGGDSVDLAGELGDSSNLLLSMAGLIIKAIEFQFNLVFNCVTFPMRVLYCCYLLVVDPCRAIRHCRRYVMRKFGSLRDLISGTLGSLINNWLKEHKSIGKLFFQFGWGLFWSIYVCIVLCGLLVFSIAISGFLMRYLVEEPIQMREELNFDYTKNSPVAFVPIMSCDGVICDSTCKENVKDVKSWGPRVIPANHKLQVTVQLTLPESEYNRNLGMFQVRVEFLSANGKTLASKSHPCMLKFKSQPIRVLLTFLEIVPLVAGYISESQTMGLNIKGFREGDVPTSCLKVVIEQRAEFRPGAGIPEIYDASLILESELPFFKRIIWYWKKTLFVWISMMSLVMELLFTLVCCRSLIIPRSRPRGNSAVNISVPDSLQSTVDVGAP